MLPITIGYIGGYETKSRLQAAAQSTWFSLGLATTSRAWNSGSFSRASLRSSRNWFADYRQHRGNSDGTLLEALPFSYHPLVGWSGFQNTKGSALVSDWADVWRSCFSCSTPVLATLLAWVATTRLNFRWRFASVLHSYVAPLILAGTLLLRLKSC